LQRCAISVHPSHLFRRAPLRSCTGPVTCPHDDARTDHLSRGPKRESLAPGVTLLCTDTPSLLAPLLVQISGSCPPKSYALWRESDVVLSHHSSVTDYILHYTFRHPLCQAKLPANAPFEHPQTFLQHQPVVMLNAVKYLDRGGEGTLFPFPTQILRDAQDDRVIAGPCHTRSLSGRPRRVGRAA
jgi:hypothetical protein